MEVPGQLRIVLSSSAVGSNKRQHFDSQAAREVFPPDVDVPAGGGEVTLVLPDGSTLLVSPGALNTPAQRRISAGFSRQQQHGAASLVLVSASISAVLRTPAALLV